MNFLSSIVEWSLHNRPIILVATILFLLLGIDSLRNLKMDAVPDVTTTQVQIITNAPSLSPLEIEQYVSFAIEKTMAGIPGIEEVRSISRYGLSVVTIVFKDDMDIYLCRQLVNERLKEARESIPAGYGNPTIGPISTGLGEIYQFSLLSNNHSTMELTTYLNWEINPILKTVPGVVEVNTFGGESMQFQILLDWEKAQSFGISLVDIKNTLESNNAAMGGGYVERKREHFLITSSGLAMNENDLGQLKVGKNPDGFPVYLKQISEIKKGFKLRLGATSYDGKGETVGAIVLMLMHENSLLTTERIKTKLEEIKKNLPEGMEISPYYDRSQMVKITINTVIKNLVEGAVLVIIVLFLILGSFRAGVIISFVIPLAMLFAIIMMRIRDEPGNLMSMGAIDFGLIVDGAVIIIENSVRRISLAVKEKNRELTEEEKIFTIKEAAIEVRKAAIFGEIIIGIVYIPILTLSGIEGKMFKPMALTVLYALSGAFIISLTIVPVMASYLLNNQIEEEEKETFLFHHLRLYYEKILDRILTSGKITLITLTSLLLLSIFMFKNTGGEFLPQLDEGSMLLEIFRLPSTSLSESQATSKRIEKALIKNIPEITSAVTRTGSPDIATDPMGIDRSDIYLSLIPKDDWKRDKSEIIESIEKVMNSKIPEVAFSVSQPIQMRTNELIAGIRSDIGIKIFGDDLETLKEIGEKTTEIIKDVPGVKDIKLEQIKGLNYIKVNPNREAIARFNLSIDDLNKFILSLSSGIPSGYIYEGRKKFEIVILSKNKPLSSSELNEMKIPLPDGNFLPLNTIAEIQDLQGPVQISHENGFRRAVVEFNVRNRDIVSVVEEIQKKLDKLKIPTGYRFEYGGNYKNFISARNRLLIVIPITLFIILFLLWLAFKNMKYSILIFFNVPFAITGGIFSLYLRDLPFSISAGVGFVALFGVAVLNGLVLISFAKDLIENNNPIFESIRKAAILRLRPVATTALVAAIGFIPMAISTNMGAEVQRPLATVVIGGIISASLLTLFILPSLFLWFIK
ncbi:MAG: efflux RND transporter permease subunit, partial [Leptospiraceae bacterium]|nr:efflux RND transporter permease subunit [Leptospiraceae bacterium]